jgi:hypothetical protein
VVTRHPVTGYVRMGGRRGHLEPWNRFAIALTVSTLIVPPL